MGLPVLMLTAYVLLVVAAALAVLYRITHPPRRGYAAALAKGLPGEPSAMGLTFEELTLRLSDTAQPGSTTLGWILAGGNPRGRVLLITHGWADSRYDRLTTAALLAPHSRAVVLYDMRGHGDSTARLCYCDRPEAADIRSVLDQLQARPDMADARFVLLGLSMGGGLSIRGAAEDEGDRIAAVIVEGAYRDRLTPVAAWLRRRRWPAWPIIPIANLLLAWRDGPAATFDRANLAAQLRCPLIALHGEDDWLCDIRNAQALVDAAPQGQLVTFPGAAHLDLAEADSTRYVDACRPWLTAERVERTSSKEPAA